MIKKNNIKIFKRYIAPILLIVMLLIGIVLFFVKIKLESSVVTATPDPAIADWKVHQLGPTGLWVKLPPCSTNFLGQIGYQFKPGGSNYDVYPNCNSVSNDPQQPWFMEAVSSDWLIRLSGKDADFESIQGYFVKNNDFYVNWGLAENKLPLKVPSELSPQEIINPNGVHILKLKNPSSDYLAPNSNFFKMPSDLGAIINTNNKKYPGITMKMNSFGGNEKVFDEILSTLSFIEIKEISSPVPTNKTYSYYTGQISPRVSYQNLKFLDLGDVSNFQPFLAELTNSDYQSSEFVMDGYTFTATEGKYIDFTAQEDKTSNPGSFISTELYGYGPTVIRMGTAITWQVPVTGRYFYVVIGNDRYGPNFKALDGTIYNGSKYGKYTLIIQEHN